MSSVYNYMYICRGFFNDYIAHARKRTKASPRGFVVYTHTYTDKFTNSVERWCSSLVTRVAPL